LSTSSLVMNFPHKIVECLPTDFQRNTSMVFTISNFRFSVFNHCLHWHVPWNLLNEPNLEIATVVFSSESVLYFDLASTWIPKQAFNINLHNLRRISCIDIFTICLPSGLQQLSVSPSIQHLTHCSAFWTSVHCKKLIPTSSNSPFSIHKCQRKIEMFWYACLHVFHFFLMVLSLWVYGFKGMRFKARFLTTENWELTAEIWTLTT
jgi:hypothetical protein